jgi:hypothetical protein
MADHNSPEEKSLYELLLRMLERSKSFLERDDISPGHVKMWTGGVRSHLKKIYGKESDVLSCFPLPTDDVPRDKASEILSQRMLMLRHFLESIKKSGLSSFCATLGDRVFIGHGRSPLWRELKDFLHDRLGLAWDEFNREAVAGVTTFDRITEMLDSATFAFLVMTAEDEHSDSTTHARQNVVHEVGLFQGRLGPRRAIILLEEGCGEFSNIVGLSQIRFPKGNISAVFEEIRRVLERERII